MMDLKWTKLLDCKDQSTYEVLRVLLVIAQGRYACFYICCFSVGVVYIVSRQVAMNVLSA